MKEKESVWSPCKITKKEVSKHLKGFLTEGEYIKDWYILDDELHFSIYKRDER